MNEFIQGLIMGLANDKSLAWGIAKRLHAEGAELAFSYQGEVMEKRVRPLAAQLGKRLGRVLRGEDAHFVIGQCQFMQAGEMIDQRLA